MVSLAENQGVQNFTEENNSSSRTIVSGLIIMELIGKSKDQNIIRDTDTLRYMINNSPIGPKYSGRPLFQYNNHIVKLYINDDRDIPELLKIVNLENEEGEWPVKCRLPLVMPGIQKYGVLFVHPEVNANRIKSSLLRAGAKITEVERIVNKKGPTYCVKLTFENILPDTVWYDGRNKKVYVWRPPLRTLICNNCSRAGHKADNCNSSPRCPQCSRGHGQRNCPLLKALIEKQGPMDHSQKTCPNCGQKHSAKYAKCSYWLKAKEIQDIRLKERIPMHEARNIWETKAREHRENNRINNIENPIYGQYPTNPHGPTASSSTQNATYNYHASISPGRNEGTSNQEEKNSYVNNFPGLPGANNLTTLIYLL